MVTAKKQYTQEEAVKKLSKLIAFLVADWGNRLLKQMLLGKFDTVSVMENSVAFLDKSTWDKMQARYKRNPQQFTNTLLFAFKQRHPKLADGSKAVEKWSYVAVGDGVRHIARPTMMTEEIKYNYNTYWGAIVCSQLLRMFPKGHDHIVIGLAHPTKSFSVLDDIMMATLKSHHVETIEGERVSFKVREVMPWDEPVGGVVFWGRTEEAQSNMLDLKAGNEILVVDVGGGISSMTRVVVQYDNQKLIQFHPVYSQERSPTIPMGVRNVMERFRIILASDHSDFKGMKEISDDMIDEGLRTGQITLSGDPVDVSNERMQAEAELLDLMENAYQNKLDKGRPFRVIITTGGGMHSYHDRLKNEMLGHNYVKCSSELLELVHFANMRGGDLIMQDWVTTQQHFYIKELTANG